MGISRQSNRFPGRRFSQSLAVGVVLLLTVALVSADKSYVIQKRDTLTGIAKRHGVSTTALAHYNGISKLDRIYAGQRLRIPDSAGDTTPYAGVLDAKTAVAIKTAKVESRRWKHIVIHHSATAQGNARSMDAYHRETRHMENGLAYHFVIGNGRGGMKDGEVAVGKRWASQLNGGHLASEAQNRVSLGICLVGNFDRAAPTEKQMRSLKALVYALTLRCRIPESEVKTHQEINTVYTRCPGRYFPTKPFLSDLHARR